MLAIAPFHWLDTHRHTKSGQFLNQLMPVILCAVLLIFFIAATLFMIESIINPLSTEKIQIEIHPVDVMVGFFLYFVTAIDYALIIGRMQVANPGSKARFVMNFFTCVGCFVGVTLVLFLWSFAKEVNWLIIPLLIFAGSVMLKLAYEGIEYFENAKEIPVTLRKGLVSTLTVLHTITQMFTFWIPELGSPKVKKMSLLVLGTWSFLLPFIIGLDDFIGYMGAMTIYNVFSLLVGIFIADIAIDIIIFVSPKFTKKMVESATLSVLAAFAFLYLAYKSYSEFAILLHEAYHLTALQLLLLFVGLALIGTMFSKYYLDKK